MTDEDHGANENIRCPRGRRPGQSALLLLFLILSLLGFESTLLAAQTETRIGDPNSSYASVEFTKDGRYMVWYEGTNGNFRGQMWHCAVDPVTGALSPPDGKGFKAFPSTAFARANVGYDAKGPFYVGANARGEVYMVRPTGARTGKMTRLAAPAVPQRKGYYPTQDDKSKKAYVVWATRNSDSSSLQYIDVAQPSKVHTIETQQKRAGQRLTAMDVGFFRVVNGAPLVTYGSLDKNRRIQIKMKDLSKPGEPAHFITTGNHNHIDPYGFLDPKGDLYVVSGIDAKALMYVYKYNTRTRLLEKKSEFEPPSSSTLQRPAMATSFEPIFHNGHIYGTYQVNDGGSGSRGYINVAFQEPGEVWLVDITSPSKPQKKLSGETRLIRTEPEPVTLKERILVFYNAAAPGARIMSATWQLRRSEVPIK